MVDLKLPIPDRFLQEEVRSGYKVSAKMKEVWAVELDLLAELLRVCKKNNIKIFASSGTLLGAVRHGGMIPWDDDIDMMMFRADYEKLCRIAPKEFQEPYFFQTEYTDPGTLRGHAQLRNSRTTAILKTEETYRYPFNQGIFIDIFPLDSVPDDEEKFEEQKWYAEKYKRKAIWYSYMTIRYRRKPGIRGLERHVFHLLFGWIIRAMRLEEKMYRKFEEVCMWYDDQETELVADLTFEFGTRYLRCRKDFQNLIELPFEFLKIPAGEGYDHNLKRIFGNYMEPVMGKGLHGEVLFDTDRSYRTYLEGRVSRSARKEMMTHSE